MFSNERDQANDFFVKKFIKYLSFSRVVLALTRSIEMPGRVVKTTEAINLLAQFPKYFHELCGRIEFGKVKVVTCALLIGGMIRHTPTTAGRNYAIQSLLVQKGLHRRCFLRLQT